MRDPRRAVGREDDVRVDAELAQDAVTSHSTLVVKPFTALIEQQNRTAAAPPLDNQSFDRWVSAVGSVFLNLIPVRWEGKGRGNDIDAERSSPGGGV